MWFKTQVNRDQSREIYLVAFPTDLSTDRVLAWLRSISGTLPRRFQSLFSVDSMVFETWATSSGIKHRLHIPKAAAEYITSQLRALVPGVTVTKDDTRPDLEWTDGIELGMSSPLRQLKVVNQNDLAASILASVQALVGDETVLIQWVITPAIYEAPPARDGNMKSADFSVQAALFGTPTAKSDELNDRRAKLDEPNLLAVGRILSKAKDTKRSAELLIRVQSALAGASSSSNYFKKISTGVKKSVAHAVDAATPGLFPAQLNLKELAAVIAWPVGQPFVAGLPAGSTRHLFATEDVPSTGRILGDSNYPGHERPVALDYHYAIQHLYVGGATGTGKTTLMANTFAQDIAAGFGAIVIDASNSESAETMFQRCLSYIPKARMDDVIVMNVSDDVMNPIGFNVLDQGNPRAVADQIQDLIAHLYQDTAGVWTRQLLFHGLYTLAERPGMTIADLMPLLNRSTPAEAAWADDLIASVKDRELRAFWQRWNRFSASERDRYTQPLINRIWQLVGRPEARNIVGQSKSAFNMKDVLKENKILLINLARLPKDTASILGTLLVNAIWTAAESMKTERANFLYLDEFQVMTKLPIGLDDMLRRSRKHNLGVVLGTQYLEDVPAELQNAVTNTARSRVIFQSSAKEARIWSAEFGKVIEQHDIMRIREYEAVAQIASKGGVTTPVTIATRAPMKPTSHAADVKRISRERYSKPIREVEEEMENRRVSAEIVPSKKRLNIGIKEWGSDKSVG